MITDGSTIKTLPSNTQFSANDLQRVINSNGIYNRTQEQLYTKFCRTGSIDPYNAVTSTREYIFMTKPDLHIFDNRNTGVLNPELSDSPIFVDALRRYNNVLKQLQLSCNDGSGPFINLLTNSCKSNMDLPGISSDDMITSQNLWGTKLFYRESSFKSDQDYEFTLEFEDTKYLEVYMFFKLFDEYEKLKYEGSVKPPDRSYITNKILHDQMSIFKIIVREDMENIIFFAKGYGVYPKSVPRDAFSDMPTEGAFKFSINFKGTFVEDMDPTILSDFNAAVSSVTSRYGSDIPFWDKSINAFNPDWCNIPYIFKPYSGNGNNPISQYKLRWR